MPDLDVMEANLNGEMNLKIETDLTTLGQLCAAPLVSRLWPATTEPASTTSKTSETLPGVTMVPRGPEVMAHTCVDICKLQQFLMGQQVNPSKAMCNIVHQRIIHLILLHEDVSLEYFIPAVA
ncbi:hypothetical protein J4Q44_G00366480 [Coregonus suidteri]|uniref:Uncharacterized protein n=1 Tax=Coregonus suidteri TaxID=861788 RepID=A0AAN8KIL8_9TELE